MRRRETKGTHLITMDPKVCSSAEWANFVIEHPPHPQRHAELARKVESEFHNRKRKILFCVPRLIYSENLLKVDRFSFLIKTCFIGLQTRQTAEHQAWKNWIWNDQQKTELKLRNNKVVNSTFHQVWEKSWYFLFITPD